MTISPNKSHNEVQEVKNSDVSFLGGRHNLIRNTGFIFKGT